ncbi:MAG: tRNA (adenosine(37)-N6)-dimethylallyltransferase MiaA [Candidatus Magasanikbacteria bacterium]|nr:tRNA (adenosine(37)-N6)-dimethylallyltransferase MiaA [Candidatus Magasanikbacteria bacterium]
MPNEPKALTKVIIIVGPTAGGKTGWSLRLAKKFNGEIISADSRQIYKKMDIGTAKEPGEWRREGLHKSFYIQEVPHHLIDFLDPGKSSTVAEFKEKARKCIEGILDRGHQPFVVGGTGLYVHALVDNLQIPVVPPNRKLRHSLEDKDNYELMKWLENLDPKTAASVDFNNKRRLIRALEVCILSGIPFSEQQKKGEPLYEFLQIGIEVPREELYARIDKRVDDMMKLGLLKEVEGLLKQRYDWKLPSLSGIGYSQFRGYFEKQYNLDQAIEFLKRDSRRYAKRQMTWFKRDPRIKWCKDYEEAEKMVGEFLR